MRISRGLVPADARHRIRVVALRVGADFPGRGTGSSGAVGESRDGLLECQLAASIDEWFLPELRVGVPTRIHEPFIIAIRHLVLVHCEGGRRLRLQVIEAGKVQLEGSAWDPSHAVRYLALGVKPVAPRVADEAEVPDHVVDIGLACRREVHAREAQRIAHVLEGGRSDEDRLRIGLVVVTGIDRGAGWIGSDRDLPREFRPEPFEQWVARCRRFDLARKRESVPALASLLEPLDAVDDFCELWQRLVPNPALSCAVPIPDGRKHREKNH